MSTRDICLIAAFYMFCESWATSSLWWTKAKDEVHDSGRFVMELIENCIFVGRLVGKKWGLRSMPWIWMVDGT
jgi:hypothetical protein